MAALTPVPKIQFFDANGNPLAGGKLYSYDAGTTTPRPTYTNYGGATPNANPVILDSRGEANVWLDSSLYKFKLTSATDVEIWTVDNVGGAATLAQLAASGGSALVGFLQAGTGAVARTAQSKMREVVSVLDFGADPTGATDSRAAFQSAVTAVIASGRGTVYVPEGTYLINGTTSSDSILNGVLFPWDNNYDLRPYVRIVGDGGVTIKAGSNSMAVFRVSTTFVEISNICIDGNGKTNVIGIAVYPENSGAETITAPRSQSYFASYNVTAKNCAIGMAFQPGNTDTINRQSGCFYHQIFNFSGNTNTTHVRFNYPYDYQTAPSGTNQNYTTRSAFYGCSFVNGNCGVYADGVGDIYFYNSNAELINSTSGVRGAPPLVTPTGVYVASTGTAAKSVQMFGGYIEACTESIFNGRTNSVVTNGTIYATPTTGNYRNIVNLNREGLTLAYDSPNAAVNMTPTSEGGLRLMADPGNAKAATFLEMGTDGVYGFALQPYVRAAGPAAPSLAGNFHGFFSADGANATHRIYHTASSGTLRGQRVTFNNASPNDKNSWFFFADDATETKAVIWADGAVQGKTLRVSQDATTFGDISTDSSGGVNIMADPTNAKAASFIQMGVDNVYGFALQPYLRASGPSAVTVSGNFHGFYSADASNAAVRDYHTGSSGTLRVSRYTMPNASPNDTNSWFQFAEDATETKFIVWSNGTVQNRTGTFSAISDAKLKENVAPAPSYWGKFKAYEFVNFTFKSDPDKAKMLGVIAQQIEQVSPGLVYETPDMVKTLDEEGNEIEVDAGTTTKAVKSSIMATVAQVVLQEAQKRIEELEARVAALEAK